MNEVLNALHWFWNTFGTGIILVGMAFYGWYLAKFVDRFLDPLHYRK